MLDVIILAAGKSTRFGKNKILFSSKNKTCILEIIVKIYSELEYINNIIVVTGYPEFKNDIQEFIEILKKKYNNPNIRCVNNINYEQGMFSSIKTGLKYVENNVKGFFIQPGDCPCITRKFIDDLYNTFLNENYKKKIVIPSINMRKGHPPLFSYLHKKNLLNYDNSYNMRKYYSVNKDNIYYMITDNKYCLNDIDTEQDYFLLMNN